MAAVIAVAFAVTLSQSQRASAQEAGAAQAPPPASAPPQVAPPMTREQRKQLLDSVDTMLEFVSQDTALPIRQQVKRKLLSRDEVHRFLRKKLNDDESAKRLKRSELVLKKFGLLPRDFDLESFLVTLLTEQVAGFYDNKTKTVNLLDWVPPAEQKPVLAHELTHALQDQTVDLERWGDSGAHDVAKDVAGDRRHVATDELETARGAIAEGQAMVVFFDDALRASGKTLADVPSTGAAGRAAEDLDAINSELEGEDQGSPVLAHAPLLLRESLLFPYTDGLSFEQTVLHARGKAGAFAGVLANPPSSTYEIMHPREWMAGTAVPVLALPDLHPLLDAGYAPYDVGAMGELDVRILAGTLGDKTAAKKFARTWDGGVYYAGERRPEPGAHAGHESRTTASLVLVYESRWSTAEAARSFAALYALGLHHRYTPVTRRSTEERSPDAGSSQESGSREQIYTTPEGDAVIVTRDRTVLVTEGLPLDLARRVRALFSETAGVGPELRAARARELALPLMHALLRSGTWLAQAHYTSN